MVLEEGGDPVSVQMIRCWDTGAVALGSYRHHRAGTLLFLLGGGVMTLRISGRTQMLLWPCPLFLPPGQH